MATATLSASKVIDPREAVTLHVRIFNAHPSEGKVHVVIDYKDSGGDTVFTDSIQLSGAQVATWIANQESTILNRYMAAKGLTGTVV